MSRKALTLPIDIYFVDFYINYRDIHGLELIFYRVLKKNKKIKLIVLILSLYEEQSLKRKKLKI